MCWKIKNSGISFKVFENNGGEKKRKSKGERDRVG